MGRKNLVGYFVAVAMALMLALAGCSGDSSSNSSSTGSAAFTTTDPATGVTISVPEGAYAVTSAQPKFTVAKNTTALPAGNPIATNGGAAGDVFTITTDYQDDFMQPVEVTVPYNPASNALPSVVYYDTANGVYVPVDVIKIGTNTVTFSTVHFSTYVPVTHSGMLTNTVNLSSFAVDSGFVPSSDGFDVANFGNFVAPDGSGLAMADFAAWYYSYKKKLIGDPQLYNRYTPIVERALISSVQSSVAGIWKRLWNSTNNTLSNKQVGMLMLMNMKLTNTPQLLIMKSVDASNNTDSAHVALAYKFVPGPASDGGTFYLYDPNFPGEVVTINFSLTSGFSNYSKAAAFSKTFTKYVYSSPSNVGSYRQFQAAYTAAQGGLGTINLTAPTVNASGVANITVTSATLPNVTVTGSVASAPTLKKLYYSLNGGTPVSLGNTTAFSFTLPGAQLTNPSIVTIYGLSNTANPWSIVAYRQITLNFTGTTVNSFVNLGFETGDMSGWTVDTRLWQDITRDLAGSLFKTISATMTTSPYGLCSNGTHADGNGNCFDGNGITNTAYNPYWGMITAFATSTYTGAPKSAVVTNGIESPDIVHGLFSLVNNGTYALRVNNYDDSYHVSTARQIATIPSNVLPTLKFAWAAVLEDPEHELNNQPYVEVLVMDVDVTPNRVLYFKQFVVGDPSYSGWVNSPTYGSSWKLIPWQQVSLDVSSAKGHKVMIRVTASDCGYGGHGAYAYLDDIQ